MQGSAYATLLIAFVLGLKHATDTDHIAAVTTLVSDHANTRRGALVGALWGLGHLITIFIAGSIVILLRAQFSPQLEWGLEFLVAMVLIWLGVHNVRKCWRGQVHVHAHTHGSITHTHLHFHPGAEGAPEHDSHLPWKGQRGLKPLVVGMIHGLAGTAGLTLLVLTSIPSRILGIVYLFVFGVGALGAMAVFSALLSLPLARAARQLHWLNAIRLVAGLGSGTLGIVLTYRALLPPSWPF